VAFVLGAVYKFSYLLTYTRPVIKMRYFIICVKLGTTAGHDGPARCTVLEVEVPWLS